MATKSKKSHWPGFFYLGVVVLVALLLLGAVYSFRVFNALKETAENENLAACQAQAEMGAAFIATQVEGLRERLEVTASSRRLLGAMAGGGQDIHPLLQPLAKGEWQAETVFVTNRQGRLLASLPTLKIASPPGLPILDPTFAISPAHPGLVTSESVSVTVSVPIRSPGAKVVGFLGVTMPADSWQAFFSNVSVRPGRAYFLFDQKGALLDAGPGDGPQADAVLTNQAREAMAQAKLEGKTAAWLSTPHNERPAFATAALVPHCDWTLSVVQPYEAAMAPVQTLHGNIFLFMGMVSICLVVVGLLLLWNHYSQQKLLTSLDRQAQALEVQVAARTQDLARSTERYLNLLQDLPDMVYETDANGRFIFLSNSVESLLGFAPEEMLGHPRREFVLAEDRPKFDEERARAETGQQMSILALRHRHKDGSVRWLSIHSRGVFDSQERLLGRRGVGRDVSQQVLAESRVRELSGKIFHAQEEERKRIALDLHDEMGQLLSALKMGLQALSRQMEPAKKPELESLVSLTQKVVDRIRALAYQLRPAILDNFGLGPALEDLCETLSESHLVEVEHRLAGIDETSLSPDEKIALFRFVQEALTNAVRHSQSRRVEVTSSLSEGVLSLTVCDFGVGFEVEGALAGGRSLGLLGMQERISLIGGELTVESSPQQTSLTVELKLGEKP